MIEIVVAVCLAAVPERCEDVHLTFLAESVTPQQCMMLGQSEIAKWLEAHPGWRPMRWTCRRARAEAKA